MWVTNYKEVAAWRRHRTVDQPLSCHREKRALNVKYARKRKPSILVLAVVAS